MRQLLLDVVPSPAPTLANFLPGRNAEPVCLLQHILSSQERERFVYLWGGLGCGKSHLLQAIVHEYSQKNLDAVYIACESHTDFNLNIEIDCVAVDNVERLDASAQIKLFNLYNQIRDEGTTLLLVSGHAAPAQLALRQDLVTRLGWGLVYHIHELTEAEKIEAMRSHAADCGFDLPQEICVYLLRHTRRDLPSLINIIDALNRYSLSNKRQITIPMLRKLLQGTS
ncbi:MAG: DnaA regulatory inactivator Hda [Nitrosomonas sp.]|nr:MAG: DnaA regulatory inactivator Hda [Nitrosomonas sp.]